jgi:predicted ribosome quality control (RQC) complex YloA/Tae2 family protein
LGIFVDNGMLSNFYTFRYLAESLVPRLSGRRLQRLFSQEKDELVVETEGLDEALVVSCRIGEQTLFLHPGYTRAKANVADIMPSVWGLQILAVSMHTSDRIITLSLEQNLRLLIQMFGSASNVLLVDDRCHIRNSFRNSRALSGQRFVFRKSDLADDPVVLVTEAFGRHTGTLRQVLRRSFPRLGSTLISEALFRAEASGDSHATEITNPLITAVGASITEILHEIESPQPRVYQSESGVPVLFSIIALRHAKNLTEIPFSDAHQALRAFVYRKRASVALEADKREIMAKLRQSVERAYRALAAMTPKPTADHRSREYERYGTLILSHLHSIPPGTEEVELHDDSGSYRIPLNPRVPLSKSAQRYFEKAKRTRRSEEESARRFLQLQYRVRTGEELLRLLRTVFTREQLRRTMDEHREELGRLGIRSKSKAHQEIPFRVFLVDGGFEVWAGKSSANNDLLTLRHAGPNDLWFHARGSGGSHVVLRVASAKGEPGKKAKEQAAGIAAYYSKMRKAKHVPVSVTYRKYVRKPRGAPPGTVHIEREKVIFATPVLPNTQPG